MFKKVKTKLNNSEKKIPDATTLIRINQYNIDKQNLKKQNANTDISNLAKKTELKAKLATLATKA